MESCVLERVAVEGGRLEDVERLRFRDPGWILGERERDREMGLVNEYTLEATRLCVRR